MLHFNVSLSVVRHSAILGDPLDGRSGVVGHTCPRTQSAPVWLYDGSRERGGWPQQNTRQAFNSRCMGTNG